MLTAKRGTDLNMKRYDGNGNVYYDDEAWMYDNDDDCSVSGGTKAEFRALRETVGMTQQALADKLGVAVRSVKRWEKDYDDSSYQPPTDAWYVLYDAKELQTQAIIAAIKAVEDVADDHDTSQDVEIVYWLSEDDYKSKSIDALYGIADDWRMANANARAVARILELRGHTVHFVADSPIH